MRCQRSALRPSLVRTRAKGPAAHRIGSTLRIGFLGARRAKYILAWVFLKHQ